MSDTFTKALHPREIHSIVQKLVKDGAHASIYFQDDDTRYRAQLVALDADYSIIGLSSLRSEGRILSSPPAQHISLHISAQGMKYRFESDIIYKGVLQSSVEICMPSTMEYLQRRHNYRALIIGGDIYSVRLPLGENGLGARLVDISAGGCRIVIAGKQAGEALQQDSILEQCRFDIFNDQHILMDVQVRNQTTTPQGNLLVGLQFVQLDPPTQALVERFVAHCDLQYRRKQSELD